MHVAAISDIGDEGEASTGGAEDVFWRYTAAVEQTKFCERESSDVELEDVLEAAGVVEGNVSVFSCYYLRRI